MFVAAGILGTLAVAGAPSYGTLKGSAEPVSNLGRFLQKYLGDCESDDPSFDRRGCETAVAESQRQLSGKLLAIELDSLEEQLRFAEWDERQKAYRLHLTPFFGERTYALTIGKPDRLNKDGLPVMKNIPIWVKSPDGKDDFAFRRQLERGMVRLELLVRPKKAWRLKRKDGEPDYRGVEAALVGLRVYALQGSNVLTEQTY